MTVCKTAEQRLQNAHDFTTGTDWLRVTVSFGAGNGGRFDASTTYVSDYPAHELAAREYVAPPPTRPQVPFDGTTSYHDEFQPKKGEPRPTPPQPGPPRPHVPFDGTTSYNTTYHAHQLPERPQHAQPQARPQVPFDATTTHKDTFVPHAIEPRCVVLSCTSTHLLTTCICPRRIALHSR